MKRISKKPCIAAYNNAVKCCRRPEGVMKLFQDMQRLDGLTPNAHTFEVVIQALVKFKSAAAWDFFAAVVAGGWVPSVDVCNALMETLKDEPCTAVRFFAAMQWEGVAPNVETWNALIRSVRVWGPHACRRIYDSMLILGVAPNADTHKSISEAGCFGFSEEVNLRILRIVVRRWRW